MLEIKKAVQDVLPFSSILSFPLNNPLLYFIPINFRICNIPICSNYSLIGRNSLRYSLSFSTDINYINYLPYVISIDTFIVLIRRTPLT